MICSHRACRNAGVKFRYCAFCKAPVAKRNFKRRHSHGIDQSPSGPEKIDVDVSTQLHSPNKVPYCLPITSPKLPNLEHAGSKDAEPTAKRLKLDAPSTTNSDAKEDSLNVKSSHLSNSTSETSREHRQEKTSIAERQESAAAKVEIRAHTDDTDSSSNVAEESTGSIGSDRRSAWAMLLEQRPTSNNHAELTAWLDKVLDVSDVGKLQE